MGQACAVFWSSGSNEWPAYKKYLKEYYRRNRAESISQAWQNEKDDGAAVNGNTDWNALTPRSSLVTFRLNL